MNVTNGLNSEQSNTILTMEKIVFVFLYLKHTNIIFDFEYYYLMFSFYQIFQVSFSNAQHSIVSNAISVTHCSVTESVQNLK